MASMEVEDTKPSRLSVLYPLVDETVTPLPRGWSGRDKFSYIGLSHNNQRVHYKGSGKNHKDAASVRTPHSIPTSCGVYYFEIKVISKGRDGYIGIGLSGGGVNLNKLPGWEKNSYGYHGDDGCVFSSSGTGQQYGPTFTTNDVVGCGFNLVDRSIFFTKNGTKIGTAVSDVPSSLTLYPTVGLQTPGEVVEANFGESPFVFNLEGLLTEMKEKVRHEVLSTALPAGEGVWQSYLHKLVLGYLVHHSYTSTAEAFASRTGLTLGESVTSMRNRQWIQNLVLRGRISRAIHAVCQLHPSLLDEDSLLLFRLKCRQFVEVLSGHDTLTPPSDGVTCEDACEDIGMETEHNDTSAGEESAAAVVDVDRDPVLIEQLLLFGRELQSLYSQLTSEKPNRTLQELLQDSFSLLAYTDPRTSPVGYLMDPAQREPVCAALNSAILRASNLPGQPPLEFALGQASLCLKLMTQNGLGAAAFATVDDVLKPT